MVGLFYLHYIKPTYNHILHIICNMPTYYLVNYLKKKSVTLEAALII